MPNYCNYEMRVVGKKENVEEFIKIMKSNYDYDKMKFDFDRHMGGRVFEAEVDEFEEMGDETFAAMISGYCAWSVGCCMFDGNYSYYKDIKERQKEKCRSTTVPIESEKLDLDIEIFSEECGVGFQEHYIVRKGVVTTDECVDYEEYFVEGFETKEEAEEELEIKITDEEWEIGKNECAFTRGGLEWDFEI